MTRVALTRRSDTPALADHGSTGITVAVLLVATAALLGIGVLFIMQEDDSDDTAAGAAGAVTVDDAWTTPSAGPAVVYLTIHNSGEADRLVDATSPATEAVSLMGGDVDMDEATATESVAMDVPPGDTTLQPGDAHLMFDNLAASPQPGEQLPLRLTFDDAGPVDVDVDVLAADDTP